MLVGGGAVGCQEARPVLCCWFQAERGAPLVGATGGWIYTGQVKADRPATDFTARLIPRHPEASIPLEAPQIIWQQR